jgi:hypothetical protein
MMQPILDQFDDAAARVVRSVGSPCLLAVSVKITAAGRSGDRWLLTLPTFCLAPPARERSLSVARTFLGCDIASLLHEVAQPLALHIGCDGKGVKAIRKVYLEDDPACANLVFVALKWKGDKLETHRYTAVNSALTLPFLDLPDDINGAVSALLSALPGDVPSLLVLSNTGPRRSMDLNLSEVRPDRALLSHIAALVRTVHPPSADKVIDFPAQVAVGRGEAGKPFVTLYSFPCWLHPDGLRTAAQPA